MSKTLLLADDSVVIQKLVGLSFANEDFTLVVTDNGEEAIARTREVRPDIVLADVVMPGRSGYEVCAEIKADPELASIPVLLLTGTFEAFDESRAQQAGANGHIGKPFEAQTLVERVEALLEERQEHPDLAERKTDPSAQDRPLPQIEPESIGQDVTADALPTPESQGIVEAFESEELGDLLEASFSLAQQMPIDGPSEISPREGGGLFPDPIENLQSSDLEQTEAETTVIMSRGQRSSDQTPSGEWNASSTEDLHDRDGITMQDTQESDLSPLMRTQLHETLERVAWEALADLNDTIIKQVVERVEAVAWEVIPQMAEVLVKEEIRRMKDEAE